MAINPAAGHPAPRELHRGESVGGGFRGRGGSAYQEKTQGGLRYDRSHRQFPVV